MRGRLGVAFVGKPPSILTIKLGIGRCPRGQTIDITVIHAKGGCNQNGIVDLFIGCALLTGASDILACDLLAASLYFAGNCEQGLQLVGNLCGFKIRLYAVDELLISVEPVSRYRT